MKDLEKLINEAFENKELLNENIYKEAVKETIDLLDKGKIRVAHMPSNPIVRGTHQRMAALPGIRVRPQNGTSKYAKYS